MRFRRVHKLAPLLQNLRTCRSGGGRALIYIAKDTPSFRAAVNEARVFKKLAQAAGRTYGVAGITLTHGEADSDNPVYGAGVFQLWQDYNDALKAATGQTRDVVMFASQQSSSDGIDDFGRADLACGRGPPRQDQPLRGPK